LAELAQKAVKLQSFFKFEDTTEALGAATSAVEGKLGKGLKKFLKKNIVDKEIQDELAVSDAKVGKVIKDKLGINCIFDSSVNELMRGIRSQIDCLVSGLRSEDLSAMQLGLAHSLSRYKLKFSPDKVDTMIVQAICKSRSHPQPSVGCLPPSPSLSARVCARVCLSVSLSYVCLSCI